ncbi:multidrug efflux system outer membrane protein [Paraburkholderia sp. GAS199]|uniref:efflux transporter outer membrane subunit n=1 Tax=Paraburkholderia sp. GAS199 TaxID=3035126 RepID=UPI003D1A337E
MPTLLTRWSNAMRRSQMVVPLLTVTVAGCSLAPTYVRPTLDVPDGFKEAISQQTAAQQTATPETAPPESAGTWKVAQPAEQTPRGEWWKIFNDPALDDLEQQAGDANQDLRSAAARVKESRALNQTVSSQRFPTIGAGFGPTLERQSPASQFLSDDQDVSRQTLWRAQATASYEVDLFGRVSDSVQASNANTAHSEALFRSVRLALQADVAQNYFRLRELDAEISVYHDTVRLREQALDLVEHRYKEGDISELDVARARAELATARSDEMTVERLRAASEHALAVLLGKAPAAFSVQANPLTPLSIDVPPGLPSSLLERRPDIAAAEYAMQAANARIGVAKSAYFPSLLLTGTAGFESATIGDLFNWSTRAFLLGPLVGTALTVPLFDGGRRKGNLDNARAAYEESVSTYRQQVLVAFREVEDSLADLRILKVQTGTQAQAVQASTRAAQLSSTQYSDGAINYLDVIDSQRTVLRAQLAQVQLSGMQIMSTVQLIRALGGGWGDSTAISQAPQ